MAYDANQPRDDHGRWTANTWTHPSTGQQRLYLNHPSLGQSKVWLEEQPKDSFGDTWVIRSRNIMKNRSELRNLENEVEAAITKMAGRRLKTWQEVKELFK